MTEIAEKKSSCHDEEDGHLHDHHVHFEAESGPNTEIKVRMKSKNVADVHIGFLQHKHKYQIEFKLPEAPTSATSAISHRTSSPFIVICEVKSLGDGNGVNVTLQLDGHKEGLQQDKFTLTSDDVTIDEFTVVLHARVLGSKKGTPMLLENIKCIAVEKDDDEGEHSDWKGFE